MRPSALVHNPNSHVCPRFALPLSTPATRSAPRPFRSPPLAVFASKIPPRSNAAMVHRVKPARWLRYWKGPVDRDAGFRSVLVYCVGPPLGKLCGHCGRLALRDLPQWDWQDISAHLRCTRCGTVGYVDTRMDWSEVIDFNRGIG